jgi:Kef-type K+ transport system membrane component KefB
MNKKTKFTITTAWILLTRSYDAYCTNQLTPDLSKESNPLVSVLGMTWTPLLITLGLLTVYLIYAYYISVFKPKDLIPTEKGYSFSEFVAFTYLGRKDNWTAIFYKLPKDLNRFNHWMGHNLTQGLVFAGLVSTIMWLLINNSDYYQTIHSATLIYSILIIGCLAIIYNWNKTMFRKYLADTNENKNEPLTAHLQ